MINMLKSLVKKVDNMPDHMKDISRDMETIRKDHIKMLEMKAMVKD